MRLRAVLFGLLALISFSAIADDAELRRLQSILATLNQQLTATYQQFQMVEQARRSVLQAQNAPHPGLDPRSYDQQAEERDQAAQQEKSLSEQMNRLLAKAQEIEKQMNPILERIYQMIPAAVAAQPAPSTKPSQSSPAPE